MPLAAVGIDSSQRAGCGSAKFVGVWRLSTGCRAPRSEFMDFYGERYYCDHCQCPNRRTRQGIAKKYENQFPKIDLVTILDFGGWQKAQADHFADGGKFDQIYGT